MNNWQVTRDVFQSIIQQQQQKKSNYNKVDFCVYDVLGYIL